MGDYVTVEALNKVEVKTKDSDGELLIFKKGDPSFMISNADFAELGPDGLKAVRRAKTKPESTPATQPAPTARLIPKAKSGKFVVVDQNDTIVSGDELFDDRAAAQAWIDAGSYKGQ